MANIARINRPEPLLGWESPGPFCALPDALNGNMDISTIKQGKELADAACAALSQFEIGGSHMPAHPKAMERLDAAISALGELAQIGHTTLEQDQNRDYDDVFGLRRSRVTVAAFAHQIGMGVRCTLRQLAQRNTLMPAEQIALIGGFASLILEFSPQTIYQPIFHSRTDLGQPLLYDPLTRWTEGHFGFFAVCSCIIVLIRRYRNAVRANEPTKAAAAIRATTNAFRTLGNSFRLAGDLTPEEYDPIAKRMVSARKGFSGLWYADHIAVRKETRRMVEEDFPEQHQPLKADFDREFNFMYHAHGFVCERLTGKRTSLAGKAASSSESALDLLRKFARLGLAGVKAKFPDRR